MTHHQSIAPISIDNRTIGEGHPSYIVAEIGINHNGDMNLAKEQIDIAAECGADAVKFQNFKVEDFLSSKDLKYTYENKSADGTTKPVTETQWDMFKRVELTDDHLIELADYCQKKGISMHSTPTSLEGIRVLQKVGVPVLKNGSDFLPNLDLIREMGKTGLPTVLSTGMATISEIGEAVDAFYETGNKQLIILHCTSSYPTPDNEVNVSRVATIRNTWGVHAGFSDHSYGVSAAILSIVYGACWIEKHFTSDKSLSGPDHRFSMDGNELKELVRGIRAAETQIGTPTLGPTKSEVINREGFRLSCVAATSLEAGTALQKDQISYHRPGSGLRPALSNLLVGRKLKSNIAKGHVFTEKDFT